MRLIRFQTKYGYRVIGGRFGDMVRSPSTTEELNAPIEIVSDEIVSRSEADSAEAFKKHRQIWNLE